MGVKHFWDMIDEAKSMETLDCLREKILSVDMSIWIVEAIKTLQFKTSILKPHLRNMFYRVLFLRRLGIKLIFVTEGEPPDLKQDTMKQRMKEQYGTKIKTKQKVGRGRFQKIIDECCEMLDYLGIPHIKAAGEAEAMCAVLSRLDLTDGCLTNDSDFFLYGGKVVYRDFGINPKDPHVLKYTTDDIMKRVGINREDMVGLALLCGCDYTNGVHGVGKRLVVKFLEEKAFKESLLQRFSKWFSNFPDSEEYVAKSEIDILRKAVKSENFLNKKIIDEYLVDKDLTQKHMIIDIRKKLFWKYPHIRKIQEFLFTKLEWPHEYTLSKVLQLASSTYLEKISDGTFYSIPLCPVQVVKGRCQQGVSLVEVEWKYDASDKNTTHSSKWDHCPDHFQTLENQQVVLRVLPKLVEDWLLKKEQKGISLIVNSIKLVSQIGPLSSQKKCLDEVSLCVQGAKTKNKNKATNKVIEKKENDLKETDDIDELCLKVACLATTTAADETSLKPSVVVDESDILPLSQRLAMKRQNTFENKGQDKENLNGLSTPKLESTQDPPLTLIHNSTIKSVLTPISPNSSYDNTPICCGVNTPSGSSCSVVVNSEVKRQISKAFIDDIEFSNLGDSILCDMDELDEITSPKIFKSCDKINTSNCQRSTLDDTSPLSLADRLKARCSHTSRQLSDLHL